MTLGCGVRDCYRPIHTFNILHKLFKVTKTKFYGIFLITINLTFVQRVKELTHAHMCVFMNMFQFGCCFDLDYCDWWRLNIECDADSMSRATQKRKFLIMMQSNYFRKNPVRHRVLQIVKRQRFVYIKGIWIRFKSLRMRRKKWRWKYADHKAIRLSFGIDVTETRAN